MDIGEVIARLFETRGAEAYHGEAVSQAEHTVEATCLAEREGAPEAMVVTAFLHDVGHLVDDHDEEAAGRGGDGRHVEALAGRTSRS